jgi:RNA polymerase sigma-70 factor (ECF subfamily)
MVITEDCVEPPAAPGLFSRARAGDAEAFCSLIEPLQTRLLRQAAALSGDLSLAEDLVSETLVEAWKSFSRYNESCRLSTWLYAILLHRWQKSLRRARSRPVSFAGFSGIDAEELHEQQENIPSPEASPAETAARRETFLQLRQCVERLPEKHRQVILLRFFEDASLPDMAVVLNCSVGTVKSRLHHALEKMREMKLNLPDLKGDEQV